MLLSASTYLLLLGLFGREFLHLCRASLGNLVLNHPLLAELVQRQAAGRHGICHIHVYGINALQGDIHLYGIFKFPNIETKAAIHFCIR